MGTRHLIAVKKNDRYGIAQYGQFDGYPSGHGVKVLEFARSMDRDAFGAKVAATRFLTDSEIEALWVACGAKPGEEFVSMEVSEKFGEAHPQMDRCTGWRILQMVNDEPEGIELRDSLSFAADSLFCEYAYVIDLDAGTFEVFKGFNKDESAVAERFKHLPHKHDGRGKKYFAVTLLKSWPLVALPSDDEFLSELAAIKASDD